MPTDRDLIYIDIARAGKLAALVEMDQFAVSVDVLRYAARKKAS